MEPPHSLLERIRRERANERNWRKQNVTRLVRFASLEPKRLTTDTMREKKKQGIREDDIISIHKSDRASCCSRETPSTIAKSVKSEISSANRKVGGQFCPPLIPAARREKEVDKSTPPHRSCNDDLLAAQTQEVMTNSLEEFMAIETACEDANKKENAALPVQPPQIQPTLSKNLADKIRRNRTDSTVKAETTNVCVEATIVNANPTEKKSSS